MKAMRYKFAVLLSLLSLPAMLLVATGGPAAAAPHHSATGAVTSSSLGSFKPTFAGPAATGCASDCSPAERPGQHTVYRGGRVGPPGGHARSTPGNPTPRTRCSRQISGSSISPRPSGASSTPTAPLTRSRR